MSTLLPPPMHGVSSCDAWNLICWCLRCSLDMISSISIAILLPWCVPEVGDEPEDVQKMSGRHPEDIRNKGSWATSHAWCGLKHSKRANMYPRSYIYRYLSNTLPSLLPPNPWFKDQHRRCCLCQFHLIPLAPFFAATDYFTALTLMIDSKSCPAVTSSAP